MTIDQLIFKAVIISILILIGYYVLTTDFDVKKTVLKWTPGVIKEAPTENVAERPWISLEDPVAITPMSFNEAGASVTLRFPIRHTGGRSPALNVSFQTLMFAVTDERSAPHLERDQFVTKLKAQPDGLIFGERTLFQGASAVMEYDYRVSAAEIAAAAKSMNDDAWKNTFLPVYVACIIYKINPNGPRHYTCIVGDVHPADPSGLSGAFDITAGPVPAAKLDAKQLYAPYVD